MLTRGAQSEYKTQREEEREGGSSLSPLPSFIYMELVCARRRSSSRIREVSFFGTVGLVVFDVEVVSSFVALLLLSVDSVVVAAVVETAARAARGDETDVDTDSFTLSSTN